MFYLLVLYITTNHIEPYLRFQEKLSALYITTNHIEPKIERIFLQHYFTAVFPNQLPTVETLLSMYVCITGCPDEVCG